MSVEALVGRLPAFAKDVKLNLSSLTRDEMLTPQQLHGLRVACGVATRNLEIVQVLENAARDQLSPVAIDAAGAAATITAMNDIYYRFVHLAANKAYQTLPARLRMNVIARPAVDKVDFELWSLAVSAINGCGSCIDAHKKALGEAGVAEQVIQTAVRIAAVIQSAAIALEAAEAYQPLTAE